MAQVILGGIGGAIAGGVGRTFGAALGGLLDKSLVAGLEPPRQRGPRLATLAVQGSAEGSPMACVFGRARVTGQVIWAARFLEGRKTTSGGKGGARTVEYDYSLSFAVALCEGPVDGIGRVWADGQLVDLAGVTMRLHRGLETQTTDPLIEAVEGTAPAYRGTAYVVFEDLPLGPYGNRPPQLSFEVFRRPRGSGQRLEEMLEGVCLIPGAGEFVLATDTVMRREGLTRTTPENAHTGGGGTDLSVSLDQLLIQVPNLKRISLVIGWFGSDLRAGQCTIRPGVERRDKSTEAMSWSVAGLGRADAHLISQSGGGPAYGGTPSDESVRQAVAELKARGLEVTLYPFVFMDIPGENGLPDPYGAIAQPAYPWRGRLRGETATADGDVAAVFGGEDDWGLRRLALHYAGLAAETGANGLLIGSEMRGLTGTRNAAGAFPAVAAFRSLATACRSVVGPSVRLSYAADWSEYSGLRAGDDVIFHLDPLWADPDINYVGIDWYPPAADWRDGGGGVDSASFSGPDDRTNLVSQIAGGEGFDWFYASDQDRAAQVRSPILDTAHGEDWVFRPKDLNGWWSQAHHDRPDGVRAAVPTAWLPGMKPIRLAEFGCPAVDRGGNSPNLFQDPKSAEGGLPPFSTGERDDRMQRRLLEAVISHFSEPANNPESGLYAGRMLEAADAWCWDARPWPVFPGRSDLWADASAWRTGHWLNGRLGGETRDLIAEILKRGGVPESRFEIGTPGGEVQGYVIDRPMRTRDALEPLLAGLGMVAAERRDRIVISGEEIAGLTLTREAMALHGDVDPVAADRAMEDGPDTARVRFIDANTDYQTGAVVVRAGDGGGGVDLDLPAVCSRSVAETAAARALEAGREDQLTVALGPLEALRLEAGDVVAVEGLDRDWRVMRLTTDETPKAALEPVTLVRFSSDAEAPTATESPHPLGAPFFRVIDLPPLSGTEGDTRPVAVVAAEPWHPMRVFAGTDATSLTARGDVQVPSTVGTLVEAVSPGVLNRWDEVNALTVRIEGRAPESRSATAILAGGNTVAIETAVGWEVVQFRSAVLVGAGLWQLTGLLRGQLGSEEAMEAGAPLGAVLVFLGPELERMTSPADERGLPRVWRAGPAGAPAGGSGVSEISYAPTGLQNRPWRPAHLRAAPRVDGGFELAWIARARIGGDRWDGEVGSVDPLRFLVTVTDSGVVVRQFEVEGEAAAYEGAQVAADFSGNLAAAEIAVAQWGAAYGWGVGARRNLV